MRLIDKHPDALHVAGDPVDDGAARIGIVKAEGELLELRVTSRAFARRSGPARGSLSHGG